MSPAERSVRARIAAHHRWAKSRLLGHGVTVTNRIPIDTVPTPDTTAAFLADFSTIAVARDLAPSVKILDQTYGDFDQMAIRGRGPVRRCADAARGHRGPARHHRLMDAGTLTVLGAALNGLLGRSGTVTPQAQQAIKTVAEFVESVTRGEGFDASGNPSSDLASIIITAAARLHTNPTQITRREIGDISLLYQAFDGFTLAERMVLHRYRRRTA